MKFSRAIIFCILMVSIALFPAAPLFAAKGIEKESPFFLVKKPTLVVRPLQTSVERVYLPLLDKYTWQFTVPVSVQAIGATAYMTPYTSSEVVPTTNLGRFFEGGAYITGAVTIGTYTDAPLSPEGNIIIHSGEVEEITFIIEYTEDLMSLDTPYYAALKRIRWNTTDSPSMYMTKFLNTHFMTEEIYL